MLGVRVLKTKKMKDFIATFSSTQLFFLTHSLPPVDSNDPSEKSLNQYKTPWGEYLEVVLANNTKTLTLNGTIIEFPLSIQQQEPFTFSF